MTGRGPRLLVVAALGSTACGAADPVTVNGAWARTSAPGQTQGAVYFDLTVADDDRLVGAFVDPAIAGRAEIHEAVTDDTDAEQGSHDMSDMSDMGDAGATSAGSGVTRMQQPVDGVALSGGGTVTFEPGSSHVMLAELANPLVGGDEFELILDFAEADDVTVVVVVADSAP